MGANRRQLTNCLRHDFARGNDIRDDTLANIKIALVFAKIANVVRLGKYPPNFRAQSQRVRKQLKDYVPIG